MKLMPKDTLNNKILPECESVRLFSILLYAEKKYVTIEERKTEKFSWANSVIIK